MMWPMANHDVGGTVLAIVAGRQTTTRRIFKLKSMNDLAVSQCKIVLRLYIDHGQHSIKISRAPNHVKKISLLRNSEARSEHRETEPRCQPHCPRPSPSLCG